MESKRKQKTIISIIIALLLGHFLVIGLTTLFADQINALIPNRFYCELFKEAAWAVVVLFCMFIFRKTEIFKITLTQMLEGMSAALPIFIVYTLILPFGFYINRDGKLASAPEIISLVLQCLLIGLVEEGLYRGVIQELFMKLWGGSGRKSAMKAIICTALMFGSFHLFNLRKPGVSVAAVLVQAASAIAIGMLLGAIFYRSGRKIWPVLLLHALIDFSGFVLSGMLHGKSQVEAISSLDPRSLILIPIFILLTLFLMRKREGTEQE